MRAAKNRRYLRTSDPTRRSAARCAGTMASKARAGSAQIAIDGHLHRLRAISRREEACTKMQQSVKNRRYLRTSDPTRRSAARCAGTMASKARAGSAQIARRTFAQIARHLQARRSLHQNAAAAKNRRYLRTSEFFAETFCCEMCGNDGIEGKSWFCADCQTDICTDCAPSPGEKKPEPKCSSCSKETKFTDERPYETFCCEMCGDDGIEGKELVLRIARRTFAQIATKRPLKRVLLNGRQIAHEKSQEAVSAASKIYRRSG